MSFYYNPTRYKGIKFRAQTSFTDEGAADLTNLRAFDISFEPDQTVLIPQYQKPHEIQPDAGIVAGQGGLLKFKTYMRGGNGSESEFSLLAKYGGGIRTACSATTDGVEAASTSTTIDATAAAYAKYSVGNAVMVTGTGTTTQMRFVTDKTAVGNILDVRPEWLTAETPANGDDLIATDTIQSYTGAATIREPSSYLQFVVIDSKDQYWTLTSCAGTWKLGTITARALPTVEWEFQCDSWVRSDGDSTAVFADTYNPPSPLIGDSVFTYDQDDTNTEMHIRSLTFDPGLRLVPVESPSGTNGRTGWCFIPDEPKIEIEMLFESSYYVDYFINQSGWFHLAFTSVNATDDAWGLFLGRVRIKRPGLGDADGLMTLKPELEIADAGLSTNASAQIPTWAIGVTGSGS